MDLGRCDPASVHRSDLSMKITIDFEDQKGLVDTGGLGTYEIKVGQWRVWATNTDTQQRKHVGYLCQKTGSPFNGSLWLGEQPEELQKQITDAVQEKSGCELRCSIPVNYRELEAAEAEDNTDTIEDDDE